MRIYSLALSLDASAEDAEKESVRRAKLARSHSHHTNTHFLPCHATAICLIKQPSGQQGQQG
jgi:hypothetical protein